MDVRREVIQRLASAKGFDAVGIVKPVSLEAGERALAQWVSEGRHGSMKYLENYRTRRERFEKEFGEIKSLIVLGVNYYSETTSLGQGALLSGRVARYARGRDYHAVIEARQQSLIRELCAELGDGFKAKSCVDTQPIAERSAAIMAGLGFGGKHTGLLNAKFGPWLFLSEIATNLDLPEDAPSSGTCGTCNYCQTACPTGALDEDYRMDARRCIAYLTIEHKGSIAKNLRSYVKDWVFGCDECLAVCPFTSKSEQTQWNELMPEAGVGEFLDIEALFSIQSNGDYEKRFVGTALLRAGRKQMMRNACLVLGNSGRPEAIPLLIRALSDRAALVRGHAAWGLGCFTNKDALQALNQRLAVEEDAEVIQEIMAAAQGIQKEVEGV